MPNPRATQEAHRRRTGSIRAPHFASDRLGWPMSQEECAPAPRPPVLIRVPFAAPETSPLSSPWFNLRGCAALRQVTTAAIADAQAEELPAARRKGTEAAILDYINRQLTLLRSTCEVIAPVADLVGRLSDGKTVRFADMTPLVDVIADEARKTTSPQAWSLFSGLEIKEIVHEALGDARYARYLPGVMSARLLCWMLIQDGGWGNWLHEAVFAALLQDCGLSRINSSRNLRSAANSDPRHPLASAALLQAMQGLPVSVLEMVVGHHERVDGGGTPRGTPREKQPHLARALAVVSRLLEIQGELPPDQRTASSMWQAAFAQLEGERQLGWWDAHWCGVLTRAWQKSQPVKPVKLVASSGLAADKTPSVTPAAAAQRALHEEESGLQGTHVGLANREASRLIPQAPQIAESHSAEGPA